MEVPPDQWVVAGSMPKQILPQYVVTSTSSGGVLPKQQREVFLDGNITSSIDVTGDHPWVEFDLEGGRTLPSSITPTFGCAA